MSSPTSIPKPSTPGTDPPPPNRASLSLQPQSQPNPLQNPTSDTLLPSSTAAAAGINGDGATASAQIDSKTEKPFSPLFTLIHDPQTNTTHHPSRIHYLFSDDDSILLTEAYLRSLSSASPMISPRDSLTSSSNSATFRAQHKDKGKPNDKSKGKAKEKEERVIVVDMSASGDVVGAASMSASWQVVGANVENAPTWEGANEGGEEGGLMLKIEGVSGVGEEHGGGVGLGLQAGEDDAMQRLMENFDAKMEILRRVIDAGERKEGA
ncbi:hypothetical protein BJ878DRAFT_166471 [Calycina marina]|uniref:Uncharacterized protein n=1 Tax=Calycina marina TaxID=1763456 RepID=A0A9P7Z912_9HELO|nr:hypothetical protein BJ878DRAFT_166471 [Calycina marina]